MRSATDLAMHPIMRRYCEVARPLMLQFMPPNSCIAATKVTCECLQRLGFNVKPMPTKFVVTFPKQQIAYTSGLTEAERATAARSVQHKEFGSGWQGHLVAIAEEWLIESAFDQATVALGLASPPEIIAFPLPESSPEEFHAAYDGVLDHELRIRVDYVTTDDESYQETEAWNDNGLTLLADMILKEIA